MDKQLYDRLYYQANKEKRLKQAQSYYKENSGIIKLRTREWYNIHKNDPIFKERTRHSRKQQYLANRDKRLEWHREHHKKRRIEFLQLVGGAKCAICGYSDWRALQIDHINGDGYLERQIHGRILTRKQQSVLIAEKPEHYQVLCCNCNWIKRYENQETAKKRIQTPVKVQE